MTLNELRDALVADLAALDKVTVYSTSPERFDMPCASVAPGMPYVEPGTVFGHYIARWTVTLAVAPADATVQSTKLNDLITAALIVLDDWAIHEVSQPGLLQVNNAAYYSVFLTVTREETLTA